METDVLYIHYRTKGIYKIFRAQPEPLLENPDTKEWTEAVIYFPVMELNQETGEYETLKGDLRLFIRSKESFNKSFSPWQK